MARRGPRPRLDQTGCPPLPAGTQSPPVPSVAFGPHSLFPSHGPRQARSGLTQNPAGIASAFPLPLLLFGMQESSCGQDITASVRKEGGGGGECKIPCCIAVCECECE